MISKDHKLFWILLWSVFFAGLEVCKRKKEQPKGIMTHEKYLQLRQSGQDEISNTIEAQAMRNYRLRHRKQKWIVWPFVRREQASLVEIYRPAEAKNPRNYSFHDPIYVFPHGVDSLAPNTTNVKFHKYSEIPGNCPFTNGCGGVSSSDSNPSDDDDNSFFAERLLGFDLPRSSLALTVGVDEPCRVLQKRTFDERDIEFTQKFIDEHYRVTLLLDGLPLLMRSRKWNIAKRGYPIGFQMPYYVFQEHSLNTFEQERMIQAFDRTSMFKVPPFKVPEFRGDKKSYYLYNHMKFVVTYYQDPAAGSLVRITGFDVEPMSIAHPGNFSDENLECQAKNPVENADFRPLLLPSFRAAATTLDVVYSYEVTWVQSNVEWSDRWDVYYLQLWDYNVHWITMFKQLTVVMLAIVATVTYIASELRKDQDLTKSYKDANGCADDDEERLSWQDGVLERPNEISPFQYSIMTGAGLQIGSAFALALVLVWCKIVQAENQFMPVLVLLYALCGFVGGYWSSRIYRMLGGENHTINALLTAVPVPLFFVLSNLDWSIEMSSLVVPWTTLSISLTFLGAALEKRSCIQALKTSGSNKENGKKSSEDNSENRCENKDHYRQSSLLLLLVGFGYQTRIVRSQLNILLSDDSNGSAYENALLLVSDAGLLLLALFELVAVSGLLSIVLSYQHLRAGNPNWCFKHFYFGGIAPVVAAITYSSSLYMGTEISQMVFGLTIVGLFPFFGTVGFLSSLWFVLKISGNCNQYINTTPNAVSPESLRLASWLIITPARFVVLFCLLVLFSY